MIKVESISIREFRGVRNLTIDFHGKNFAICGPNGTGKSGLVDAIEFALTGNISRLSGRGTKELSLLRHAPHVDSRDNPANASVLLTVTIPSLNQRATIERTVRAADSPIITPSTPEITRVFDLMSRHPEFVLSRREIIRYVLSPPGDRARDIEALLQLNKVEELRASLQKITNALQKQVDPLKQGRIRSIEQLKLGAEISELAEAPFLASINKRRTILGLQPIGKLSGTTSIKEGVVGTSSPTDRRIPKRQALQEITEIFKIYESFQSQDNRDITESSISDLEALNNDPRFSKASSREQFLKLSLELLETDKCPLCDTPWNLEDLRSLIGKKLIDYDEFIKIRHEVSSRLESLITSLDGPKEILLSVERYGKLLSPPFDISTLQKYRIELGENQKTSQGFNFYFKFHLDTA